MKIAWLFERRQAINLPRDLEEKKLFMEKGAEREVDRLPFLEFSTAFHCVCSDEKLTS